MPDATNRLIAELDDPTKFECVRGVPVFRAHEREMPAQKLPDGRVIPARKVKVTDADLPGIADRMNRQVRETGQLSPLVIGHRSFAPDFPEGRQPELAGFARNFRVERVQREGSSFLAVVEDEYVMRDQADALKRFPYRSLEYDFGSKVGIGTAMLIRPPYLSMGSTIVYQAGDPTVPDMPNPAAAPTDADDFTPDETKAYERCARYFRKMKYMAEAAGPTNAETPAPVETNQVGDGSGNQRGQEQAMNMKDEGKSKYQANPLVAPPASPAQTAVYAELAQLRKRLDDSERLRVTAECRTMLDPFKDAIKFDYERELSALASLPTAEARAGHVKYMAEHYAPLPTAGGMVQVYSGTAHMPSPTDNVPSIFQKPDRHDEVMTYMNAQHAAGKSCQYHEAKAAVLARYAK